MITVGDRFPEFTVQACCGIEDSDITQLSSGTFEGKWKTFVFYRKDFTFVCPTELIEFSKRVSDFEQRDCVIIGASTDNEYAHLAWRRTNDDLKSLPYPLIAASKLARDLDILDEHENICHRATYIVDPTGVVQFVSVHPPSVGRSVDEVLRTLAAIQSEGLCPCNWQHGEQTIAV